MAKDRKNRLGIQTVFEVHTFCDVVVVLGIPGQVWIFPIQSKPYQTLENLIFFIQVQYL